VGGSTKCGLTCVDTDVDSANCGACGNVCPAGQVCSNGGCGLACAGGSTKCGNACVSTASDPMNCGGCNVVCPSGQVCSNGVCGLQCSGGTTKCGNLCTNTLTDAANCGGCGNGCPSGQLCSNGSCNLFCFGGTTKCGNACVITANDAANCGACGNACAGGAPCVNGSCQQSQLYTFSGVQNNVPIAQLTGWSQCYIDTYANSSTSLSTILAACSQSKLLLGCRTTGSSTLLVAANAPRVDVIFDTGTSNTPHNANGVGWYYNSSYSWGFAPQGDVITRNSCDTQDSILSPGVNGGLRLCWHTGNGLINTGWRCGMAADIFQSSHERLIFQAP
jgi:hypothetical protein